MYLFWKSSFKNVFSGGTVLKISYLRQQFQKFIFRGSNFENVSF